MSELARFQTAFAEALIGDVAALAPWSGGPDAEPGLSVYRNTVAKGCADAIAAQFPTLVRAVGEAWLRDAAVLFARAHPPASPCLADYGAAFPDWLAAFPPAADLPWLPGLARLDWALSEALFAADQPPLLADDFARLAPDAYASLTADLHPAARLLWFADGTPSLWRALQGEAAPAAAALSPEPEGLLVTRPDLEARHQLLSRGAFAFLEACRSGLSLAAAGEAALQAEPDLPLAATFADLIAAGAFARLRPPAST
ncbi:MAG: hypothetical protein JWP50_1239 [Phenylobacterium sp.]|nr:hypothetical protein [Phenylobacterium sp.]